MSEKLESLKKELVEEIQQLAEDLAKNQSFVGLLSYESKFNSLHEKFITLKFLERRHLGLDIFDSPIPPDVEAQNMEEVDTIKDEEPLEYEFKTMDKEEPIDNEFEENVMDYTEECIDTIEDREQQNTELNDAQTPSNAHIDPDDDYKDLLPTAKLPKIQIDFNDRIAFLNQLFDGSQEKMDSVIQPLNHMNSLSDAKTFLADIGKEFEWSGKEEYIERLSELIEKRFD